MEENHISGLEISGFKRFDDLKVENIGQFNLIVGDNNVGKTSLLESLLIDRDSNKFLSSLSNITYYVKKFTNLKGPFFNYYFPNTTDSFPQLMRFKITINNQFDILEYRRINSDQYSFVFSINSEIDPNSNPNMINPNLGESRKDFDFTIPYIPFGALYNHELTKLYSNHIQLFNDKKEKLIDSLSFIIPKIKNIEVNASYSTDPILLISEKNKNKLAPLGTYGDGTLKLFRILLSLFSNDNLNRLMIDELDAGVHYSRLKDFINSLLIVAKEQKKQIFATTHSKECIQYFSEALKELAFEDDGRIIRLAETKTGIKSYTNIFEQFENSLIADSEIR